MPTSERFISNVVKGHYKQPLPFDSQEPVMVRVGAPEHLSYLIGRIGTHISTVGDYATVQYDISGIHTCISIHLNYLKKATVA